MKKNIVVLVTAIFLTLLATAATASIEMWRKSGSGKLTATLTYTDQITGKKTIRSYVNYSGLSSNYIEVHRDPANNHFLFKVNTENDDPSGMTVDVSAVGNGISKSTGAIEVVSAWVNTLPDCSIRLAEGVSMEAVKAIKITSDLSLGPSDQCTGPIYLTASGTVNYYGSRIPGCITMTAPFKNARPSSSPYDSISRGSSVALNQPPEILNANIPVVTIPFGGTTEVYIQQYINDENPGTVTIDSIGTNLNGTPAGKGTSVLNYTASDGFTGSDFCSFTVQDEQYATSNTGVVNFYIDPLTVPAAMDRFILSKSTDDFSVAIDNMLISNYGPELNVSIKTKPSHGTATVNKDGGVIGYVPFGSQAEFDYYTYKIDRGMTWEDIGTVVIIPY